MLLTWSCRMPGLSMIGIYILLLKQVWSRDSIRFRNPRGKLRRVPGVLRRAFDVRFSFEVILSPTVEGPCVSRVTAGMGVGMASQVAVDFGHSSWGSVHWRVS